MRKESSVAKEGGSEEEFLCTLFSQVASRLKEEYGYSEQEINRLWSAQELAIPVNIFSLSLSPAEALVKFLKEHKNLRFTDIAEKIGRNQRTVWCNYHRAIEKMKGPLEPDHTLTIPISAFTQERSILSSVVTYLKEVKGMRSGQIAKTLNKSPSTIWASYHNAKHEK